MNNFFYNKKKEKYFTTLVGQKKNYTKYIKIYEKVLSEISANLSFELKINRPPIFWRAVIGPYLQELLGKLYFLYNVNEGLKIKNKNEYVISDNDVFNNTRDFGNFISTDTGIKYLNSKIIKSKNTKFKKVIPNKEKQSTRKLFFVKLINKFLFILYFCLKKSKKKEIIIAGNFLPSYKILAALFFFGKYKYYFFENRTINFFEKSSLLRNKILKLKDKSNFSKILNIILIETFPTMILENILTNISSVEKFGKNKIFVSTNQFFSNDWFKFNFVSKKSKLIILQHGGRYNQLKENITEVHEKKISSKFVSLGFDKKNCFNYFGNDIRYRKNKKFIFIEESYREPFRMGEGLPAGKESLILEAQSNNLANKIISKFMCDIKPHPISKKNSSSPFRGTQLENILKNYNLAIISSLYSTPFLKLLHFNFPFVIIFKSPQSKMSFQKHVQTDIKILFKCGILHKSEKSLLKFLKSNIKNIDKWWLSNETQIARKILFQKYLICQSNIVKQFETII